MTSYDGREIPVTNFRTTGGVQRVPSHQESMLQQQRSDMDFMNNAVENIGAGNANIVAPRQPLGQADDGLGWLQKLLGGLSGAGTDESTDIAVGNNKYAQQKKGTFDGLIDLFKALGTTAMGQQSNMYGTAGGLLGNIIGEQGNLLRTNAATEASNRDLGDFWKGAGALNPKLAGITAGSAALQNTGDLGKGLPVNTFFKQGLGNTGIQGLFGGDQPPPPPETSPEIAQRLGSGRNVPKFKVPREYEAVI